MPTPVTTARQCLTDEAARALNDAVSVAKRRNHAQTTSLHAVSALLTPSFSLLRDSLSRARSSAYSPRLQLRALDLCVSVSLDRLPTLKSSNSTEVNDDFAPPISNSLMAAIKRSQAHQRRQPDMYHLSQINHINNSNNNNGALSISCIKVELKHFVLSILDDPIVSRVLGEAGFRSSDIKLAIIQPPRWTAAGMIPRRPPLFLCNLTGSGLGVGVDENCKRISEVMVRKKGERNPVLIGVCANDALIRFKENVIKGGVIKEFIRVKLVCLEKEIKEKDSLGLEVKIQEAKSKAESESKSKMETETGEEGIKVVVNLGEISELISDNEVVIKKVSGLVEECGNKVRLIMEARDYEMYSKLIGRFPNVDKDWDLQPLPITASSSSSSTTAFDPKSSLMGSFVPFGGFFPTPSDFRAPLTAVRQPFIRCNACNESYERELRAALNEGSVVAVSGGDQSSSMPSWLQRAETDPSKSGNTVAQVNDVRNEKISCLQKKWDDNCRLVHQKYPFSIPPVSLPYLQVAPPLGFPLMANVQGSHSSSGDSSLNERACSNSSSSIQIAAQNISPQKQVMKPDFPKGSIEIAEYHPPHYPLSTVPVTTDLGLGMISAPKSENNKKHFLQEHDRRSNHGGLSMEPDFGDYKALFRKLTEVVPWQSEAICRITEIISSCQIRRRSIWLNFVGPDKIGQKKIAQTLADAIHGRKDYLIALNLSCQDSTKMPNSLFQGMKEFDINASRITVVDHIAQELSKKPQSVVFLENVDEADPLVQNSLTRAIQTGKFPDTRGKEVAITNVFFVMTSKGTNNEKNLSPRREFIKFLEEKILEAKNWEMQLAIRSVPCRSNETTVSLLSPKYPSAKRKLSNFSDSPEDLDEPKRLNKMTKKSLDLNLPLEDSVEMDCYEGGPISDMSKAWLKDFLDQVDGNVAFKQFDFDALADSLLRKMRSKLEETLSQGQRISLEIDHEVMLQVLAATWFADEKGAVDEWIKDVLGSSLSEARERYHVSDESVVRLGSSEGVRVKEWAPGIRLPRRINLSI
ncbi:protein SMAX1-LIKE 7-like [Silene latifolia]|uniref:protein SMAX1-LIKE 7-like n=1 Tax=Silene latifolia TaxID=37657 RepID=UPI003D775D20